MTNLSFFENNGDAEGSAQDAHLENPPLTAELVIDENTSALASVETELQVTDSIDYNFVSRPRPVSPSEPASWTNSLLTPWSMAGIVCLIAANALLSWHQFLASPSPAVSENMLDPLATSADLPDVAALTLDQLSQVTLPTVPPVPSTTLAVEIPAPPDINAQASSESLASLILPPSLQPQAPGFLPSAPPPMNAPAPPPPTRSLPPIAVRPVYTPSQAVTAPLPPPPPPSVPAQAPIQAPLSLPPAPNQPANNTVTITSAPQALPQEAIPQNQASFNQKTRQTLIKNYNRDQGNNTGAVNNDAQQLIQGLQNLNQAQ